MRAAAYGRLSQRTNAYRRCRRGPYRLCPVSRFIVSVIGRVRFFS